MKWIFLICGLATADLVLKVFFQAADPKFLSLAILYYKITLIGIPFVILDMVVGGALRGEGDIKYVIVTSIVALWTFRVGISVLLVKLLHLGLYGVMIGIFLDFCIRGLMYVIRMRAGNWKYLKV